MAPKKKQNVLFSLTGRIVIAVVLGVAIGFLVPDGQLQPLNQFARAIIQWVKIIAGPFLFVSVLASLIQIHTSWVVGLRLICIALVNTAIALFIGISLTLLLVMNSPTTLPQMAGLALPAQEIPAISWENWMKTLGPPSLFEPFVKNDILLIALLALLCGIAVRRAFAKEPKTVDSILGGLEGLKKVLEQLLGWLLCLIPFAVFFVIASSVSQYGFDVFRSLAKYVVVVILALFLQCTFVYGGWIFVIAKMGWKKFWAEARHPLLYALGVNSSLATLPITMKALKNLGVSDRSAGLGAGVATNLNNDGIVLYEASAVFFIAHLHNVHWDIPQMIAAALACVVAAVGITGVPEAGFISLSVVATSLGLPMESLPLLLSVDWIIARLRSGVNVLSDMTLSIAMDLFEDKPRR